MIDFERIFVTFLMIRSVLCDVSKTLFANGVDEARFVPPPPPFAPPMLFPVNAATGILVAIAVPVTGLPDQNVFVSYNFEGNYNMPNIPADSVPGKLQLEGPTRVRIFFVFLR